MQEIRRKIRRLRENKKANFDVMCSYKTCVCWGRWAKRVVCFARNDVGYGELLLRHYELRFVCRTPQRCRQCIRLQPATDPQERCNTSLPTRQFGNLSAEMRYIWRVGCRHHVRSTNVGWRWNDIRLRERGKRVEGGEPKGRKRKGKVASTSQHPTRPPV